MILILALVAACSTAMFWSACWRIRVWSERAAYWQQECGEQVEIIVKLSPDAQKWRLARAARRQGNKAKSQAQSTLIAQTTAADAANG